MRTLELLAPAKNLECGIAAISHGADAVYIGAPRFGARAAAGNSYDDIRQLCEYAHRYGAKVHVTVNTIVYDSEIDDTLQMIDRLQEIGVDALLLQDMGVLRSLHNGAVEWKRELHASTQCDTRNSEKVRWLQSVGFNRAVLARELSLEEIREIHRAVPDMDIEVFVHGALCVCYSGVCYASQYCFSRSANRGECAQFCRLKFDLVDADGKEIEHQRHLLSLKDLCQIDRLEDLADAGACSFKIEGRLKDVNYVKNVVSAYSRRLDQIVARRPQEYRRASHGVVNYSFEPNLKKTFNRGFTHYFLDGRIPDIVSFDTPKAMGEYVGKVKEIRGISFNVAGTATFANGDGLCFINDQRELDGFRVNRAEGNRLFPQRMPQHLRPGLALYRNNDVAFEKQLAAQTAVRQLPIEISFRLVDGGFEAEAKCQGFTDDMQAKARIDFEHQEARQSQQENIIRQLGKLGNTPFVCHEVKIEGGAEQYFVPSSLLADLRRKLVEKLLEAQQNSHDSDNSLSKSKKLIHDTENNGRQEMTAVSSDEYRKYGYLYNIANKEARTFYAEHGMPNAPWAFELNKFGTGTFDSNNPGTSESNIPNRNGQVVAGKGKLLMQCRHCLRYSLGYCVKRGGRRPSWREPLSLVLSDGRRFQLEFACHACQMNVYGV